MIVFLICVGFLFAQDQKGSSVPSPQHISRSYILDGPLDKATPPLLMKPGSVQTLQNMKRPNPGIPLGWEPRKGSTKFNTTTIGAVTIKGLFRQVNAERGVNSFYAQAGDSFYLASAVPPSTTTTFGTSVYSPDSGASSAFGESIGDDLVLAATGTTPWATSGATGYPDGFLIDRNSGNTIYETGYDYVRDNRTDTYVTIVQSASDDLYVGYRRRLTGVHLYFVSGATNSATSGVSGYARRSQAWSEISLTDGTSEGDSGVTTFYEDGAITWTGSALDQHFVLPGTSDDLFWYKFTTTGDVTDGIKVKRALVIDRTEAVTNLWSGMYDLALGALKSTVTGYVNYTGEVNDGTKYEYADLSSLATTQAFYVGFGFKTFGFHLGIVDETENSGTSATATVSYWNATTSAWTSVGTVTDGTKTTDYSMAQSGVIQWDGNAITESKSTLGGILRPLYWYKIAWSATLPSTGPHVYEIGHVQKPETIPTMPHYDGVIEYAGRALYWPGAVNKHGIDFSYPGLPHVMNGPLASSTGNIFGPGIPNAVVRHYMNAIVSTANPYRLYLFEGKAPGRWDELLLSDKVGAVAPKSMVYVSDGIRLFSQDRTTHATFFLAHDGIYATDGQTVICISNPISKYWDRTTGPYIEGAYAYLSHAWTNYQEKTIHFAVPMNLTGAGTQTTLNREIVYNYVIGEFYDLYKRANPLSCGVSLIGSSGQVMTYGGGYAGNVRRLDVGTGDTTTVAIEYFLKTSDISPLQGVQNDWLNYSAQLRGLKLKGKASSAGAITTYVYADGATSATATDTSASMVNSGKGYYSEKMNFASTLRGESFAIQFSTSTLNATGSFLGFTMDFYPVRETY